ncbi:MAG: bifunctional nicotinamidase/pyrazinamidase [Spirochaetaceae bacterium]|jgi:nicotinamidase/pyrazinamidase|nr:bifunctional nicotinamidase/pyrazinamidase [Spirochaetaceae bacterium]
MNIDFKTTALLEIDVQNDFCPNGALAVFEGCAVTEPLNRIARIVSENGGRVIATADWHPASHCSFKGQVNEAGEEGLWPPHCVQGTMGAAFHHGLDHRPLHLVLHKGFRQGLDSYSAFFENDRTTATGLEGYLKGLLISTILIGGLATDYCVLYTALDAKKIGFRTIVLKDACRAVGSGEESEENAWKQMKEAGIEIVNSDEIG